MGDSDIKKEVEKQKEPQKTEKTAKKKAGFFRSLILGVIIALLDFVIKTGLDKIIQIG